MRQARGRTGVYEETLRSLSQAEGIRGKYGKPQNGARFVSFAVRLNDSRQMKKALELGPFLALQSGASTVVVKRSGFVLSYQFQLPQAHWESYTRADLPRPQEAGVGLAEGRRQVNASFENSPHILCAGVTGSGKTETLKSILTGLLTTNTPESLEIVCVDIKGKFSDYHNLAHLAMPIARDENEIDTAIAYVNSQIIQRERASQFDGRRIVLLVDEAESVFADKAHMAMAEVLTRRGREVRCNAIFATQEPHRQPFRKLLSQINNRFIGYIDSPTVAYQVTGKAATGADQLTGRGDFLNIQPGGIHDRLQVVMSSPADLENLPRGELVTPEFERADIIDADVLPDNSGGRPYHDVDPKMIAYYLLEKVTRRKAKERFDFGQTVHLRHKTFADAILNEIKLLKKGE